MKDDLFTDEEQVPYDMVTLLPLRDGVIVKISDSLVR
jgi:hypothetical protein